MVKNILNGHNIIFYNLVKSIKWKKYLKKIRYNFLKFVSNGGWKALASDDKYKNESEDKYNKNIQFSSKKKYNWKELY